MEQPIQGHINSKTRIHIQVHLVPKLYSYIKELWWGHLMIVKTEQKEIGGKESLNCKKCILAWGENNIKINWEKQKPSYHKVVEHLLSHRNLSFTVAISEALFFYYSSFSGIVFWGPSVHHVASWQEGSLGESHDPRTTKWLFLIHL